MKKLLPILALAALAIIVLRLLGVRVFSPPAAHGPIYGGGPNIP
jgi:hypothetical protein